MSSPSLVVTFAIETNKQQNPHEKKSLSKASFYATFVPLKKTPNDCTSRAHKTPSILHQKTQKNNTPFSKKKKILFFQYRSPIFPPPIFALAEGKRAKKQQKQKQAFEEKRQKEKAGPSFSSRKKDFVCFRCGRPI